MLPRRPIPKLQDLPWAAVCELILKIVFFCPYYVDRFGDKISFSPVFSSDGESCQYYALPSSDAMQFDAELPVFR